MSKKIGLRTSLLLVIILLTLGPFAVYSQSKVVIGYIPTWTKMQAVVDNIDFNIVTHVNIAFMNPNSSGLMVSGGEPVCCDASTSTIKYVVDKVHSKGRKVLISLGGGSTPSCSGNWMNLLSTSTKRMNLVNNMVSLCNFFGFDGIDVDLEGNVLSEVVSAGTYTLFIESLHSSLSQLEKLVTCASAAYNGGMVPESSFKYFDYVNVMSYDNGWGSSGNHSTYTNAITHIKKFLDLGCPADKLVLGVPFYGYGAIVGSNEIAFKTVISKWDSAAAYVDSYLDNQYNGIITIENKTQYAVDHISGIMIWELSQDALGPYSLLQAIGRKLGTTSVGTNVIKPETFNEQKGVEIYPNPTISRLNIRLNGLSYEQIKVCDILGRTVLSARTPSDQFEIDISHLECGIYFIHFIGESITSTKIFKKE